MKNLVRRASSGAGAAFIVLAWLVVAQLFSPASWLITLLLALVSWGGSLEYAQLVRDGGLAIDVRISVLLAVLVILGYAPSAGELGPAVLALAAAGLLIRYLPSSQPLAALRSSLLGLVYIPYLLHFFYVIYLAPNGLGYTLLLLGLVWAYDSGAYLVGHRWGRHKFFPARSPSPQKSWEGVAGGLLFALAIGLLSRFWIAWPQPPGLFLLQAGGLALLIGCSAQLGDLFESKLKREAGVKDSGTLFPGHGGLLDRIDSLLLSLPLFYGYLHYLLGWL